VASAALPPDLRLIGNVPDQSPAIVMWVQTSDPAPYPPDVADRIRAAPPPQHYWRTGIFTTYNGSGWEALDFSAEAETTGPEIQPRGRYRLLQRFDILAPHGNNLFAANLPITVTAGAQVQFSQMGDSAIVTGTVSNYQVLSWVSYASASQLNSAGTDYPPEIASTYLQLPATLPQRVRALADRITAAAATPYDKAQLVQEYLRSNLTYTLRVPPPPAGQDAVDYFLFEAPGGYCSYYASAMAVMLRAEGVPARVVTGYAMGTYDFQRAAYSVPGASAHAWVEVYFPTYGWVEFEPTASLSEFDRSPQSAQAPPAPTQAPPRLPDVTALGVIPWGFLVAGLGLALLGMGLVRAYRGREPGWNTPRGRARSLYRQMRTALAEAGLRAPEHLTPDEFRAACEAPLANYPALALALDEATRLYVRATFSGRAPNPAETGRVWRLWFRALGERLRLWWRANLTRARQGRPGPKPGRPTLTPA
jgi:transglutaminase-like putative cysteine protease